MEDSYVKLPGEMKRMLIMPFRKLKRNSRNGKIHPLSPGLIFYVRLQFCCKKKGMKLPKSSIWKLVNLSKTLWPKRTEPPSWDFFMPVKAGVFTAKLLQAPCLTGPQWSLESLSVFVL